MSDREGPRSYASRKRVRRHRGQRVICHETVVYLPVSLALDNPSMAQTSVPTEPREVGDRAAGGKALAPDAGCRTTVGSMSMPGQQGGVGRSIRGLSLR